MLYFDETKNVNIKPAFQSVKIPAQANKHGAKKLSPGFTFTFR